jgi:hypothetical protein
MIDAQGYTTNKRIELATQVDPADYLVVADQLATDLAAVTELQIIKLQVIIPVAGPPYGLVGANSYVDKGCTITGLVDGGGGKKASVKVPSPEAGFVNPDGSILLTGAMATFLAHFEAAGDCLLSDGEDIASWIRGLVDR